jgi:C4-dicarboxylate transporter DctQ subunit
MTFWKKILSHFNQIERPLVVVFYSYFTLIIIIEVFRRYVLNAASAWAEESARYAFIYMTYIGAAEAIKSRNHLKIDIFQRYMNERQLFGSYLLTDACFIILAVLVIRYSIKVMQLQIATYTMMQGLDFNLAFAQAAIPVGWILILVRLIQRVVNTINRFQAGQSISLYGKGMLDES